MHFETDETEQLKTIPLFKGLSSDELLQILNCSGATVKSYRKGESVLAEGETDIRMGVVLNGTVITEKTDYNGNRFILSRISSSGLFGMAFVANDSTVFPLNVTAFTDCRILFLKPSLLTVCSANCPAHSRLLTNLLKILAGLTIEMRNKIDIMSRKTTREKLLAYLKLASCEAGSLSFDIPYNRQQLADYLCVERSALSTVIGELVRDNLIRTDRKHFELILQQEPSRE